MDIFEDEEECFICIDCAKDYKLKKYILSQDFIQADCHFCKKTNPVCLQILDNSEFMNFMRALIRFHYWEDEYNRHFGGDNIACLIGKKDNPIFNSDRFVIDGYCLDDLVCGIEDVKYNDESKVEIYYGHQDGFRCSFGKALKYNENAYINRLKKELFQKNYFLLEDEFISELSKYIKFIDKNLDNSKKYYRARVGIEEVVEKSWDEISGLIGNYTDVNFRIKYIPYSHDKISAPPVTKVEQGRLNRNNVSYLYIATDIETAISEVRPHPGHKVSVGCFRLKNTIRIADLNNSFQFFSQNEESLKSYTFLNDIDKHLSMPVIPEEKHMYLITQFFSDCFRKMNFDGISFTSSVGPGENFLIFNPENFEYIEDSASVFEVEKVEYAIKKINN